MSLPEHFLDMLSKLHFEHVPQRNYWVSAHDPAWWLTFSHQRKANGQISNELLVLTFNCDRWSGEEEDDVVAPAPMQISTANGHNTMRNLLSGFGYPVLAIERLNKLNLLIEE